MSSLIVIHGETMYTKEEHKSSDDVTDELSLAEQVFTKLLIDPEGFQPSFFTNKDLANLRLTSKTLGSIVFPEWNQRAAKKLVTHVVQGEQYKAQVMIKKIRSYS
jgi:hypothetical protein